MGPRQAMVKYVYYIIYICICVFICNIYIYICYTYPFFNYRTAPSSAVKMIGKFSNMWDDEN